ncbi:unnamed protein product [Auanema sp. JU1783]|nr:unnamed protein product [Auanema sp. JU1783]
MVADEASTPYTEGSVVINDLNIGYAKYGNGSEIVVCICGAVGSYKKDWPLTLLKHFDPSFVTLICIDPPGYGTSRPPERVQEVGRCTKDGALVVQVMEKLEIEKYTVMGWSEGARTSIHVAARGKGRVQRLILLAPGSKVSKLGSMAFSGMRNTDHWLPSARAPYLAHYSDDYLKKQWADLCDVVQQVYDFCGGRFPCDYELPSITCPTLVVNGGLDRFCGDAKDFISVIKNSKLEVHAQGGHDFYLKYPKWFSDKIQNFLRNTTC